MKTLTNYSKIAAIWLLAVLFLMTFSTCQKDDDEDKEVVTKTNISGQWEFILIPDVSVPDTTLIKGLTGADFEEVVCINDEVFLYQDENGNIKGFAGPIKLSGILDGKNISLHVYDNPNGKYNPARPLEDMKLFSNMTLVLDDFGLITGNGTYEEDPENPNIINNTYKVEARKISTINKSGSFNNLYKNGLEVNHWYSFICNEIGKLIAWVTSKLTDGKVRSMGSCWPDHNGGGYYMLGHEGPGEFHSIFTTTIYFPLQATPCKARTYDFDISIKGENISIATLIEDLQSDEIKDLAKKLGFTIPDNLFFAVEEFYNQFGGFGITLAWDKYTNNMEIYVNHLSGSSHDAINNVLIQKIKSAFEGEAKHVYVSAGNSISDTWYLKRDWDGTCNPPLIFVYLFGTHNVNYD